MSDNEEAASLAQMRTVHMHTGEQFESGEVHRRRGLIYLGLCAGAAGRCALPMLRQDGANCAGRLRPSRCI